MKLLLPKDLVQLSPAGGPLFFLAGPIRGGGDWQNQASCMIGNYIPNCYIANPRRYDGLHPLWKYRMVGDDKYFDRQLTWERHYLDLASRRGCIIFWLPCESETAPRTGEGSYAMDTRGELGEWRGRLMHNRDLPIVIGAEVNFPGLSQIQRNFNLALGTDFTIYPTLGSTISAAIERVQRD